MDTIIPLKKSKKTERRGVVTTRQVAAQSNAVEAMNTESTSSTERRSDSKHTRKSHERRVRQSER